MKSLIKLFAFSLVIGLTFYSCGDGSATEGDSTADSSDTSIGITDTEIKIGSFGPLTGPAALWGNITKGMDAYFKMVNEKGGINGRKINFIIKDDAYDPSRTVPAVREMVQKDEVFAIVGGIGTAPCMSVVNYLVEEDIPFISPISGGTHWSIPFKKNVFSVLPYYIDEGIIQVKYAIDSLNSTKIGIIYQNDDVGKSALVGAKDYMKTKGLDFVAEVPVEVTDTDLNSHVARLKDSGADVVLLWTLPRQGVITVASSAVIGYKPQYIASFILSDISLMHGLTKGAWEGIVYGSFTYSPYDYSKPEIVEAKEALAKYYPDVRWGVFPFAGFTYGQPFVKAIERMGKDVTREKLISELEKMQKEEFMGLELSFSPDNHQATRAMQLLRCTGPESFEVVTDFVQATSDIEKLVHEMEAM